jgi:hypothetical protein
MPALLTQTDRFIHGLRIEIERQERFAHDADDDKACDFHRAIIADLRRQLEQLQEREN